MTEREYALLADVRLSREARIMGLFLAHKREEVQVSTEEWQQLLGRSPRGGAPKRQTIAGYVSELEMFGWVKRRHGGRGSPYYTFLQSPKGTGKRPLQSPSGLYSPPAVTSTVPQEDGKAPPPPNTTITSTSDARERFGLDERAERAMEQGGETLTGCRGALRDYLTERVEPRNQYGYVQSVRGCIEGTDEWCWMGPTGSKLHEGRAKVVAGALNEMLQGDEVGTYFPAPPGSYKNLRSKVRYRARAQLGADRDAEKKRAAAPPDAPTHARRTPFPEDEVENDAA